MAARYADPFLNALMFSHQITVRAELWYNNVLVGPLNDMFVAGSINADRSGSVRRTAQIQLDPGVLKDTLLAPKLNPYGSRVKIWRGIRYPGGSVDEVQVFFGRIDAVDTSFDGLDLRLSDLAADVVDARFLDPNLPMTPFRLLGSNTPKKVDCIRQLIVDALPGITVDTASISDVSTVRPETAWAQERGDALDSLCTQISSGAGASKVYGAEWFIDMTGVGRVKPLPAVISSGAQPVWIIDTGDVGVMVDRVHTLDRTGVYNGISVDGTAVGGTQEAHGFWKNDTPSSVTSNPMVWGGPFGKVTGYYTGQQLDPNDTNAANNLAKQLGLNALASVKSVNVTCMANAKLQLGDIVRVFTGNTDIDGMYFVQNFTLPLDPETPMTMTLYSALTATTTGWRYADETIPEGATWQPTR